MSPPRSDRTHPRTARLLFEMRATWSLALPLVLGQLSAVALSVVDTLLAGRHGPLTLAGVAVGSAVWSIVLLVVIGVLMAVPACVSQHNGADRRDLIGPLFRQALWLAFVMGWGLFVLARFGGLLLAAMRCTWFAATSAKASRGRYRRWCSVSPACACSHHWAIR